MALFSKANLNVFGRKLANTSSMFSKFGRIGMGMAPIAMAMGQPELAAPLAAGSSGLMMAGELGSAVGNAMR